MSDDVTVRIGAEAERALSELEKFRSSMASAVSQVRAGEPAFDKTGAAATVATNRIVQGQEKAAKATSLLDATWGKLVAGFAASTLIDRGIGSLARMATQAFETAGTLVDLSTKTGLSTEALQRYGYVAKLGGSDLESVAEVSVKLSRNIATGTQGIRAAVSELGLSYDDLRAMSPEEQFDAIAVAVASVANPQDKIRLGLEVYGRAGAAILPAITKDFIELKNEAVAASDEAVRRLEKWGDEYEKLKLRASAFGVEATATFGVLLESISAKGIGPATLIDFRNRLLDVESAHGKVKASTATPPAPPVPPNWSGILADARQSITDLDAAERARVFTAIDAGASAEQLLDQFGLTSIAVRMLTEDVAAQTKADEDAAKVAKKRAEEFVKQRGEFARLLRTDAESFAAFAKHLPTIQLLSEATASLFGYEEIEKAKAYLDAVKAYPEPLSLAEKAARMTADAQRQVHEQTGRAIVAYRLLGLQAPEDISRLHTATANFSRLVKTSISDLQAHMGQLGAPLVTKLEAPPLLLDKWRGALGATAGGFQQLAQIADQTMADIARNIGTAIAASDQFLLSLQQFKEKEGGAANIVAGMTSLLGVASTIANFAMALHTPEWEKVMRDVGRRWGVEISEGLAKEIADAEATIMQSGYSGSIGRGQRGDQVEYTRGAAREMAELLSLDKILAEAGDLSPATFDAWIGRAKPLFDIIRQGGEHSAAATRTVVTLLEQFGEQATETGGLWSTAFREMLADTRALGIGLDEINALMRAQGDAAAEALGGVTGHLVGTQENLDRTSRIALATFNAIVASGRSPVEAMDAIRGSVDQITAALEREKLIGNDAYQELARWGALTEKHAPLLASVGNLTGLLTALENMGALTVETFADLEAQGVDAFQRLQAAGFTEQEALAQMAPLLERIRELHVSKRIPIEEGTQALLDQAEAAGILSAQEQSAQQVMQDGFSAIIEALGGEIPAAWKKTVDAAAEAADKINGGALAGIRAGLSDVEGQLNDGRMWDRWRDKAAASVREVGEEVDHLNFGHSPGGLKEIPLMLQRSQDATEQWRFDTTRQFERVQAIVDRFALPGGKAAPLGDNDAASGGFDPAQAAMDPSFSGAGDTPVVVQAQLRLPDGRALGEFMIPITAEAMAQGRIPVPSRAVRLQVPRG